MTTTPPNIFTRPATARAWVRPQPMASLPTAHTRPELLQFGLTINVGSWEPETPMQRAASNAGLLLPHEIDRLMGRAEPAAERMATGRGTFADLAALGGAAVIAQAIEATGVVRGLGQHLGQISETLEAIGHRGGARPDVPLADTQWTPPALRSSEMDDVRLLARLLRFQLGQISWGEYKTALKRATGHLRSEGATVEIVSN